MIDNLPESNGYIFLSMTQKFWRFLTLDRTKPSIWAHRDPTPKSSRFFSILSTSHTYCESRTLGGIFATLYTLMAPLKTVPFTVAWYYTGGSLQISCNIFSISRQIPLTKFLLPHHTAQYGDSKDISCFSSTSMHRSQSSTNNSLRSYVHNKLPTYFRLLHTFAAIFGTDNTQHCVESWYFFLNLQVLQWFLVQKDVETKHKKWNFIRITLFSHKLLW